MGFLWLCGVTFFVLSMAQQFGLMPSPNEDSSTQPAPTATATLAPTPSRNCDCEAETPLSCNDFDTQSEAQTCFDDCSEAVGLSAAVAELDDNDDGVACEDLPPGN